MKQLSGADNLFLYQERGNQTAHVGSLAIYDPSTAPGGHVRFKSILAFFTERLNASPVFRRRLVRTPLDLDRPYWIDEPEIDIEYHVRHIALPQPGDWRQLMIQIARIHSRPLDLAHPAWEAYVIEGLDNVPGMPRDSFAMYLKIHHSVIDGQAGAMLLGGIHSLTPDAAPAAPRRTNIADREPTGIELLARMVGHRADQVRQAALLVRDLVPLAAKLGVAQVEAAVSRATAGGASRRASVAKQRVPVTRFDGALSPHRVIDSRRFALTDFQTIRAAYPDVTINDIFLAMCGGALRTYLQAKGELPQAPLHAQVPVSTRSDKAGSDAGNQITLTVTSLHTDVADPIERLMLASSGARRTKKSVSGVARNLPARISAVVPVAIIDRLLRQFVVPTFNLTVSNVRGPATALYLAGAKLQALIPINMLIDGMGLSITAFSYDGTFWVSMVADRKAMPDPGVFSQCLTDSFEDLLAAARKPAGKAKAAARKQTPSPRRQPTPRDPQ